MITRGWCTKAVGALLVLRALCGCGLNGLCAVEEPGAEKGISGPVRIDAADPVLRWQAFPREEDVAVFGAGMRARITNVRYDFEFWVPTTRFGWSPTPTIVTGLQQPEYRFAGLAPGETYRWAARATFDLDGRPRVTQWTSTWAPPPVWDKPEVHPLMEVVER